MAELAARIRMSVAYVKEREMLDRAGTYHVFPPELAIEAADEIERLTAERDRLRLIVKRAGDLLTDADPMTRTDWIDACDEWMKDAAYGGFALSAGVKP